MIRRHGVQKINAAADFLQHLWVGFVEVLQRVGFALGEGDADLVDAGFDRSFQSAQIGYQRRYL